MIIIAITNTIGIIIISAIIDSTRLIVDTQLPGKILSIESMTSVNIFVPSQVSEIRDWRRFLYWLLA